MPFDTARGGDQRQRHAQSGALGQCGSHGVGHGSNWGYERSADARPISPQQWRETTLRRRLRDGSAGGQLVDGTDHGLDAHAVVDLLHEGADYLHYFGCRARVACPDQLAYLP